MLRAVILRYKTSQNLQNSQSCPEKPRGYTLSLGWVASTCGAAHQGGPIFIRDLRMSSSKQSLLLRYFCKGFRAVPEMDFLLVFFSWEVMVWNLVFGHLGLFWTSWFISETTLPEWESTSDQILWNHDRMWKIKIIILSFWMLKSVHNVV